jgi:tRNA pseudouridine55 synthase
MTKGIYVPGINGVFALNKPSGPSSQEIVSRIKNVVTDSHVFEQEYKEYRGFQPVKSRGKRNKSRPYIRIGHGGTLDPIATGVLVMGLGKGTQTLIDYLQNSVKTYRAVALFGAATTTYDSEGKILRRTSVKHLTDEKVREALKRFDGTITQLPPVYSALKMDGKPLYDYAREGKPLPRPIEPRECQVSNVLLPLDQGLVWDHDYELPVALADFDEKVFHRSVAKPITPQDIADIENEQDTLGKDEKLPILTVDFTVSSGTYIRTLIHDLGLALDTTAHMVKLTRLSQGPWVLGKNVLELDELENQPESIWWAKLKAFLDHGPAQDVTAVRAMVQSSRPQPASLPVIPKVVQQHETKQRQAAPPTLSSPQPSSLPAIPTTGGQLDTSGISDAAAAKTTAAATISPEIAMLAKNLGLAVPGDKGDDTTINDRTDRP